MFDCKHPKIVDMVTGGIPVLIIAVMPIADTMKSKDIVGCEKSVGGLFFELQAVNGVLLFLLFPTFESFFLLFLKYSLKQYKYIAQSLR